MIRPGIFKDVKQADNIGRTAEAFLTAAALGDVTGMKAFGHLDPNFNFGVVGPEGNAADLADKGGHQAALKFLQEKGVTPKPR